MKKLVSMLLVGCIAGSLAGCGGATSSASSASSAKADSNTSAASTASTAEAASSSSSENSVSSSSLADSSETEAVSSSSTTSTSGLAQNGTELTDVKGAVTGNDDVLKAAKESGKVKIGVSIPQLANPYFVSVEKGIQNIADENGYEVTVVDAKYDVAKQVSDFENFMNQGVTAVIACPIDSNALEDVTKQMNDKGIAVISFAQLVPNANAYFTGDEYTYGTVIGSNVVKWIDEKLDGKGNVLIISQDNVESVVQRGNGIEDTIKKNCPDAVIVDRQAGDNPESGMKIAENVMQAHPEVNVIVGNNDAGPLGAVEAVNAMNLDQETRDKFFVGGADATPEAIAKMKEDGSIYRATVDITPYATGQNCVKALKDMIDAGKMPTGTDVKINYWDMVPVWQDDVLNGWKPEGSD
jgi:ribose transport system substrate-binding protein